MAGKASDKSFAEVTWYPGDIKAPAGEFVTLEITNPTTVQHDFTSEDLDCATEAFDKGETISVSFKVPPGKSDFVCNIHEAVMTGDIIGTK
jgi:plastocyanin